MGGTGGYHVKKNKWRHKDKSHIFSLIYGYN